MWKTTPSARVSNLVASVADEDPAVSAPTRRSMSVDVVTEVVIARSRKEVAAYAADPDNATRWYRNIRAVEWRTPRPFAQGTQVTFVARFMRRVLVYTYEVAEYIPETRLVMRTVDGPFPMETSYVWADVGADRTRMTLRNRGEPRGMLGLFAPFVAAAMRRANREDLDLLRKVLEHPEWNVGV